MEPDAEGYWAEQADLRGGIHTADFVADLRLRGRLRYGPQMFKTALITGASSGIGRELALALAKQGTEVIIAARRAAELERVRDEVIAQGGRAHIAVLDVAQPREAVAHIQALDDRLGGIDLVIANAGVGVVGSAKRLTWDKIEAMCQVNFSGAIATLTALLPRMVTRRKGHLAGVSSLIAYAPAMPGSIVYQATKAGFSHFLDGLRIELTGSGVSVTAIHPGFVHTEMTAPNKHPMPFVVSAEDAAALIARKLLRAPAHIDFPLPMVAINKVSAMIPEALTSAVTRRLRMG
jgi:short-subunit dehydrogenase